MLIRCWLRVGLRMLCEKQAGSFVKGTVLFIKAHCAVCL